MKKLVWSILAEQSLSSGKTLTQDDSLPWLAWRRASFDAYAQSPILSGLLWPMATTGECKCVPSYATAIEGHSHFGAATSQTNLREIPQQPIATKIVGH